MKKYMMITPETFTKLGGCFAGGEEVQTFVEQMNEVMDELAFNKLLIQRVELDQSTVLLMKQICIFSLFCREHMDLIHQLIANLSLHEMTEEEINKFKGE